MPGKQGEAGEVDRFYAEFGRRLREARTGAGLSQDTLGVHVGLNRTSISNIEKGRQRILLHQLPLLASTLETTIGELLPPIEARQDVLADVPEDAREWAERILGNTRIDDERAD